MSSPFLTLLPVELIERLDRLGAHRSLKRGEVYTGIGEKILVLSGELAIGDLRLGAGRAIGKSSAGEEALALADTTLRVWRDADLDDTLRRHLDVRLSARSRRDELYELLRRSSQFAGVSAVQLLQLLEAATLALFPKDTRICRQGETGDAAFLIVKGEVAIEQDQRSVARLHRGDFFGEIALILDMPRTADAIARTDVEALILARADFDALVRKSASFRRAVQSISVERLSGTSAKQDPELILVLDRSGLAGGAIAGELAAAMRALEAEDRIHVAAPDETLQIREADYVVISADRRRETETLAKLEGKAATVILAGDERELRFNDALARFRVVHRLMFGGGRERVSSNERQGIDVSLQSLRSTKQISRIARALTHRTVGVALGGGAAWGYGHCALLRGLSRAGIPVDVVAGVSFGSIAGAFYASRGLAGIDRLIEARNELAWRSLVCTVSTQTTATFVRRHVPESVIEELELPYLAIAVDIERGAERVFKRGDLATAVRASCAFPGVFATTVVDGVRYVDACVKNNVPASALADWGADFIIASNIVPPPAPEPRKQRGLLRAISPFERMRDTVRSMYLVVNDTGTRQAAAAHATFSPDLSRFLPTGFNRAPEIIRAAEIELEPWLESTIDRYRAFIHGR